MDSGPYIYFGNIGASLPEHIIWGFGFILPALKGSFLKDASDQRVRRREAASGFAP
jgi:hypothetical protein